MSSIKANINVEIDANVKETAVLFLNRMGLDQTTAIELFYRQIIAERRLPFQPVVNLTLDEQIIEAALENNPEEVELPVDENGNIIIDKDKYPELYDWAVNG